MTRSSPNPGARAARSVDELIAAEWDPQELFSTTPSRAGAAPAAEEQDALIEAMAGANAAREAELARELEQRVADAHARGIAEGRQAGEAAEGARLRHAVQAAEDALEAIRAGESRWLGSIEENVCALAVAVSRQVIGRELKGDGDALTELVRRAVSEFPVDQPIRIRVAPQDLEMITSVGAGDGDALPGRHARWIGDPVLAPGGCLIEGHERIVDGRVDAALERLYRRLTNTHA